MGLTGLEKHGTWDQTGQPCVQDMVSENALLETPPLAPATAWEGMQAEPTHRPHVIT